MISCNSVRSGFSSCIIYFCYIISNSNWLSILVSIWEFMKWLPTMHFGVSYNFKLISDCLLHFYHRLYIPQRVSSLQILFLYFSLLSLSGSLQVMFPDVCVFWPNGSFSIEIVKSWSLCLVLHFLSVLYLNHFPPRSWLWLFHYLWVFYFLWYPS